MRHDASTSIGAGYLLLVALVTFYFGCLTSSRSPGDEPQNSLRDKVFAVKPIAVIPPGTRVAATTKASAWNQLVLVASPKINSGDIDAVSESVRDAATLCSLTIMATVKTSKADKRHRLVSLGVGYSADGPQGKIVVSPETASELGVSLGFIAKQVLHANEEQLAEVSIVAMTSQLAIFDAASVMYRGGSHRKYVTRHLVHLDETTGKGRLMSWLLAPTSANGESMGVIKNPIRVTDWGTEETRRIHVDEDHFNFFGVPGELAFALEDLPPGTDINWSGPTARLAGRKSFSGQQLNELATALLEAKRAGE